MIYLFWGTLFVIAFALWIIPPIVLSDKDHGWWAIIYFMITTIILVAILLWYIDQSDNDGVHQWRGGAGPATICEYERKMLGVPGKGGHMATYTVCRDPGRQ